MQASVIINGSEVLSRTYSSAASSSAGESKITPISDNVIAFLTTPKTISQITLPPIEVRSKEQLIHKAIDTLQPEVAAVRDYWGERTVDKSLAGHLPDNRSIEKFRGYQKLEFPENLYQYYAGQQGYLNVPVLQDRNGNVWNPVRITSKEGKMQVYPGTITSLAERKVAKDKNETYALPNIWYSQDPETGQVVVTCGVIDNQEKAEQFAGVIEWLRENKILSQKDDLRFMMLQLNTKGLLGIGEAEVIDAERHSVYRTIDPLIDPEKDLQFAHLNRCIDGFGSQLPGQESDDINLRGVATLITWIHQAVCKPALLESIPDSKKLRSLLKVTESQLNSIEWARQIENEHLAKESSHTLNHAVATLGKEVTRILAFHAKSLDGRTFAFLRIMQQLIADQQESHKDLEIQVITQAQEVATLLFLSILLNVNVEINCFSGADRTGFVRSLYGAIQWKWKQLNSAMGSDSATKKMTRFLLNYEADVQKMDRYAGKKPKELSLPDWIAQHRKPKVQKKYLEIWEFQQQVFDNVLRIALEIVRHNSWVEGLKWGYSQESSGPIKKIVKHIFRNDSALPYLPKYVFDEASDKWIKIISRQRLIFPNDRKGRLVRNLTQDGKNIFCGRGVDRYGKGGGIVSALSRITKNF